MPGLEPLGGTGLYRLSLEVLRVAGQCRASLCSTARRWAVPHVTVQYHASLAVQHIAGRCWAHVSSTGRHGAALGSTQRLWAARGGPEQRAVVPGTVEHCWAALVVLLGSGWPGCGADGLGHDEPQSWRFGRRVLAQVLAVAVAGGRPWHSWLAGWHSSRGSCWCSQAAGCCDGWRCLRQRLLLLEQLAVVAWAVACSRRSGHAPVASSTIAKNQVLGLRNFWQLKG
ncbi:hypothetical protein SELMODRAFT_420526 [Selaginella moellendorffii]|uniref:Uncharacterized protein n=1 Tax=Selaginella moellendorffii TaxID=88036 RepID=D8SCA0_SELML|nr:hypothetical protein SELMODRAFT_420526 [Selaginella moellendorffii]